MPRANYYLVRNIDICCNSVPGMLAPLSQVCWGHMNIRLKEARNRFLGARRLGPNSLRGSFKTHKFHAKKGNKMATAMCFCYVLRHSLVKWKKITLHSPLKFLNCTKLLPEYISQGFISSLFSEFRSEKRKQDDSGGIVLSSACLGLAGIFYKVVFGATPAECTGEEEIPAINTPSGNAETRDSSGRFSSSTKVLKTKERKRHATYLLKGVNSAKEN